MQAQQLSLSLSLLKQTRKFIKKCKWVQDKYVESKQRESQKIKTNMGTDREW